MLQLWGYFMIHQLREQGCSISEFARQLELGRKTVRKYLARDPDDQRAVERQSGESKLQQYHGYLKDRLDDCETFPTTTTCTGTAPCLAHQEKRGAEAPRLITRS